MNLINSLSTILVFVTCNFDVQAQCNRVPSPNNLPVIDFDSIKNDSPVVDTQNHGYSFKTVNQENAGKCNEVTVLRFDDVDKLNHVKNFFERRVIAYNHMYKYYGTNLTVDCYFEESNEDKLLYFVQRRPENTEYNLHKLEEGQLRKRLQKSKLEIRVKIYQMFFKLLLQLQQEGFPIGSISIGDFLVFWKNDGPKTKEVKLVFYPQLAEDRYASAYKDWKKSKIPDLIGMMSKLKDLIMHIECHPTNDSITYSIACENPQDFDRETHNNDERNKCFPAPDNSEPRVLEPEIQELILYLEQKWTAKDFNLSKAFAKIEPEQLHSDSDEVFQENVNGSAISGNKMLNELQQAFIKKKFSEKHDAIVQGKKNTQAQSNSAQVSSNRSQNTPEQIRNSDAENERMDNGGNRMIQPLKNNFDREPIANRFSDNDRFKQQAGLVVRTSERKNVDPKQRNSAQEGQSIAAQNRPSQRKDEEIKKQSEHNGKNILKQKVQVRQRDVIATPAKNSHCMLVQTNFLGCLRPSQQKDEESKRQSKNSSKKKPGFFSCFLPKNII